MADEIVPVDDIQPRHGSRSGMVETSDLVVSGSRREEERPTSKVLLRGLEDSKKSDGCVAVKHIVVAAPRWWIIEQKGSTAVGNEEESRVICPPPKWMKSGADIGISAGVVVIPWGDVDEHCRLAGVSDEAQILNFQEKNELRDAGKTVGAGDGDDDDDDDDDDVDDDDDDDVDDDDDDDVDDDDDEDVDDEEKRRNSLPKLKAIANVLELRTARTDAQYLCVDGGSVLKRMRESQDGSDSKVQVKILHFSSPAVSVEEARFVALQVSGVKGAQRRPGVTNILDYASSTVLSIMASMQKTAEGKRLLSQRLKVTRTVMRAPITKIRCSESERTTILEAHQCIYHAIIRSKTFKELLGEGEVGHRHMKAAKDKLPLMRTFSSNALGNDDTKERKSAILRIARDMLGFMGDEEESAEMSASDRREFRAMFAKGNGYLAALEYLHDMPLTQVVLRMLDMKAPALLRDAVFHRTVALFRTCLSDAGAALYFLCLYNSWNQVRRPVIDDMETFRHVAQIHKNMLEQVHTFFKESESVDAAKKRIAGVLDLPREWGVTLSERAGGRPVSNRRGQVGKRTSPQFDVIMPAPKQEFVTDKAKRRKRTQADVRRRLEGKNDGKKSTGTEEKPHAAHADEGVHRVETETDSEESNESAGALDENRLSTLDRPGADEGRPLAKCTSPYSTRGRPLTGGACQDNDRPAHENTPSKGGSERRKVVDRDAGAGSIFDDVVWESNDPAPNPKHNETGMPNFSDTYLEGVMGASEAVEKLCKERNTTLFAIGSTALLKGFNRIPRIAKESMFLDSVESCYKTVLQIGVLAALRFSRIRSEHSLCALAGDSAAEQRVETCCSERSRASCKVASQGQLVPCPCSSCMTAALLSDVGIPIFPAIFGHPSNFEDASGIRLRFVSSVKIRYDGIYASLSIASKKSATASRNRGTENRLKEVRVLKLVNEVDKESYRFDYSQWCLTSTPEYVKEMSEVDNGASLQARERALGFVDMGIGLALSEGCEPFVLEAVGEIAADSGPSLKEMHVQGKHQSLFLTFPGAKSRLHTVKEEHLPLLQRDYPFHAVTPYPLRVAKKSSHRRKRAHSRNSHEETLDKDVTLGLKIFPREMNAALRIATRDSADLDEGVGVFAHGAIPEKNFLKNMSSEVLVEAGDFVSYRSDVFRAITDYSSIVDFDAAIMSLIDGSNAKPIPKWSEVLSMVTRILKPRIEYGFSSVRRSGGPPTLT